MHHLRDGLPSFHANASVLSLQPTGVGNGGDDGIGEGAVVILTGVGAVGVVGGVGVGTVAGLTVGCSYSSSVAPNLCISQQMSSFSGIGLLS